MTVRVDSSSDRDESESDGHGLVVPRGPRGGGRPLPLGARRPTPKAPPSSGCSEDKEAPPRPFLTIWDPRVAKTYKPNYRFQRD